MVISFSSSQIDRFKRDAKKLVRERSIPHNEALDHIAVQQGFKNWSLLAKHSESAPAEKAAPQVPLQHQVLHLDRYYLHGDQGEDDQALFFCARCDAFTRADHFDDPQQHTGETHRERYLASLDRWNRRSPESKAAWRRTTNAVNLLAERAVAERAAREAAHAPFHRWLLAQTNRDDLVGDLATDARRDKNFPSGASTRRELERYLSRHGSDVIQALREAWREFSAMESTT